MKFSVFTSSKGRLKGYIRIGLNIAPKGNIAPNQRNIAPATETASVK